MTEGMNKRLKTRMNDSRNGKKSGDEEERGEMEERQETRLEMEERQASGELRTLSIPTKFLILHRISIISPSNYRASHGRVLGAKITKMPRALPFSLWKGIAI